MRSWERYEAGVDDYLDVDDDRVLVLCWQRATVRGSSVPVQMDWAQLCTLKRGLVCRMAAYSDRAEALEAVGLRE